MNLYSHARRAKSCKKDNWGHRCVQSGKRPQAIISKMKIPVAKAAEAKAAWDFEKQMAKAGVVRQAKQDKIIVHFSSREHVQMYKRRVVFLEVDNVKYDDDYKAFAEQCASASQMQAANFLDTISRFLGLGKRSERRSTSVLSTAHLGGSQRAEITGERMPTSMDTWE